MVADIAGEVGLLEQRVMAEAGGDHPSCRKCQREMIMQARWLPVRVDQVVLLSSESKVDGVTPWAKQALNAGGPEAQSKITNK